MMSEAMDDLEMVRRCAQVMQVELCERHSHDWPHYFDAARGEWGEDVRYDPLTDDAQAMALVKRFRLEIAWNPAGWAVNTWTDLEIPDAYAVSDDLNRAICECVARMP